MLNSLKNSVASILENIIKFLGKHFWTFILFTVIILGIYGVLEDNKLNLYYTRYGIYFRGNVLCIEFEEVKRADIVDDGNRTVTVFDAFDSEGNLLPIKIPGIYGPYLDSGYYVVELEADANKANFADGPFTDCPAIKQK